MEIYKEYYLNVVIVGREGGENLTWVKNSGENTEGKKAYSGEINAGWWGGGGGEVCRRSLLSRSICRQMGSYYLEDGTYGFVAIMSASICSSNSASMGLAMILQLAVCAICPRSSEV